MEKIIRKGIAFERRELALFDSLAKARNYRNRSEAIRHLIRKELISEQEKNPEAPMMATLTIVYSHHEHHVQHNITHLQHNQTKIIRSTLHVHMDDNNCMEVLILDGRVKEIKLLANSILASKGVKHGELVLAGH